jgi:hypothetical protein
MSVNLRNISKAYIYLIVLTIISAFMGEVELNLTRDIASIFLVAILMISTFKGLQIIDTFMELKHAPKLWRKLLLSYVVLIPTIIALIYILF